MMNFDVKSTHERRPQRLSKSFLIEGLEAQPDYLGTDYFQTRYILEMKISTSFWSNAAQMERKVLDAKKMANAYLFKDMTPLVREIMADGDDDVREKAAMLLDMMMDVGK